MLTTARVEANIPASDLKRARTFYTETLGIPAADEMDGYIHFETAGGTAFNVYETTFAGQAGHTIAQWHVDDIVAEVAALKTKGVAFETYDLPGMTWDDDIATMPGMGRSAWFKDTEGNILCIDQDERAR